MIIKTSDQSKASSGATALYVNLPASIHTFTASADLDRHLTLSSALSAEVGDSLLMLGGFFLNSSRYLKMSYYIKCPVILSGSYYLLEPAKSIAHLCLLLPDILMVNTGSEVKRQNQSKNMHYTTNTI